MNYIIFGGSGFIGTHLIHLLKETHPEDKIYDLDIVMPGEEGVVPGIQYLVASGNQKLYSQAFTISSLITVALNIFLGLLYGIYGISIAAPIGEACLTILLILNGKKVKEKEL